MAAVDQATQVPQRRTEQTSEENYVSGGSSSKVLLDSDQPDVKFCALLIKVLNALCNIPTVLSGDSKHQGQIVSALVGEVYGTQVDVVKISKHLIRQKIPRLRSEGYSDSGSGTETIKPPQGKKKKGDNGSGNTLNSKL